MQKIEFKKTKKIQKKIIIINNDKKKLFMENEFITCINFSLIKNKKHEAELQILNFEPDLAIWIIDRIEILQNISNLVEDITYRFPGIFHFCCTNVPNTELINLKFDGIIKNVVELHQLIDEVQLCDDLRKFYPL